MQTAKTDQTGKMPRLIWVFAGHTYHFVGFASMWLNYYIHMYVLSVNVFRLIWYFWFQMYVVAFKRAQLVCVYLYKKFTIGFAIDIIFFKEKWEQNLTFILEIL